MSEEIQSPFVPGAVVAIEASYSFQTGSYHKTTVNKVYKNGNFTIATGNPSQQWRPQHWGNAGTGRSGWTAYKTGNRYAREHVVPWNAELEARIAEIKARRATDKLREQCIEALKRYSVEHNEIIQQIANLLGVKANPEQQQ